MSKVGTLVVVTVCELTSFRPLVVCYDLEHCCHHACNLVALQCDCSDYDLDDAESLMTTTTMMMLMCMDDEDQGTPRLGIPHVPIEGGHGCSRIWVCRCQQESGDPNRRSKTC